MCGKRFASLLFLFAVIALSSADTTTKGKSNVSGIFINSDAWNFWLMPFETMNEAGIRADVDFYTKKGGVEAIFYNMNFQRSFYDTKVGTPIWKDCEIKEDGRLFLRGKEVTGGYSECGYNVYTTMIRNVLEMRKNCPDYMAVRYQYCHEKGVEMWHSMRMDDVHHTPLGLEHRPQHCDMWIDRKDLIRAWYRHTWRGEWIDNALDYGQKEVYDYHLAMAREYLLDYESDGLELDWLRCAPIFKPGYDEMNTPILTQFMRDVRKAADEAEKKWGHRIRIAARVPGVVTEAMGMGMDVPTWTKEHLIDVLIPSPRNTSTEEGYNVSLWRILAPKPVILAPCIDCNMTSNPGWSIFFTMETDCGFASNYYQQGADTIYFYNHFPRHHADVQNMQDIFAIAGDPKKVAAHARRQVHTRHEQNGEGVFAAACYPLEIWGACCNGGVKVNAGQETAGRKARIIIGATVPLNIDVLLNTVPCPMLPEDTALPGKVPTKKDRQTFYVQAEIPSNVLHDGWNDVEIYHKGNFTITDKDLIWMEIYIEGQK